MFLTVAFYSVIIYICFYTQGTVIRDKFILIFISGKTAFEEPMGTLSSVCPNYRFVQTQVWTFSQRDQDNFISHPGTWFV